MSLREIDAIRESSGRLPRDFTLLNSFALAFAIISPIVALYSIFSVGLSSAGPSFWFAFPTVFFGQAFVACVFAMLVSRFPYEGSIYQWSKCLVGERYAWFSGWTHQWAQLSGMAVIAVSGAPFLAQLFALDSSSRTTTGILALLLLVFATWGNTHGRKLLNAVVALCIISEIVASIGVGIVLITVYRVQPLSVLWSTHSFFGTGGFLGGLLASKAAMGIAICGWALVGFESAGSIAEEVKSPETAVPKAMLSSLVCVAAVVSFAALSLILAIPDMDAVTSGKIPDPVAYVLIYRFGPGVFKALLVLFMLGFVASLVGVQASVSRVTWAFARDRKLPFSGWLSQLSSADAMPVNSILVSAVAAGVLILLSFTPLHDALLGFSVEGFYIAFGFPILAAATTKLSGTWINGPFTLGLLTTPVIYIAAGWIILETVNIAWPRAPDLPWYQNWAVILLVFVVALAGVSLRRWGVLPANATVAR